MFRFKGCPRCHGDLLVDRDEFGWYEECIQCGFTRDMRTVSTDENKEVVVRKRRRSHRNRVVHAG
ncbi:MAG: hypothetical protein HYX81_04345 [Chloroflexi bacterium]|nr:hypothetical protein [Chloroflexota bacterium]MBI4267931.1 hypothetical protein [Chloroflexota bacterium]